jgi:hypothetical protein
MVLLRWSSTQFARDISSSFVQLHRCLLHHLDNAFSELQPTPLHRDVHIALLQRSIALDSVYQQAAFELRVGHLSGKTIHPSPLVVLNMRLFSKNDETVHWNCGSPYFSIMLGKSAY